MEDNTSNEPDWEMIKLTISLIVAIGPVFYMFPASNEKAYIMWIIFVGPGIVASFRLSKRNHPFIRALSFTLVPIYGVIILMSFYIYWDRILMEL